MHAHLFTPPPIPTHRLQERGDNDSDAGSDADEGGEIEEPLVNRLELTYDKSLAAAAATADPTDILNKVPRLRRAAVRCVRQCCVYCVCASACYAVTRGE